MNTPRLTTRTLVFSDNKLLLVRNTGANFWYPPGGGMEATDKDLPACAEREVLEETGIAVKVMSLAWVREFQMDLETFWIARPLEGDALDASHADLDENGEVEHVGWFTEQDMKDMTVYPSIVHTTSFNEMKDLDDRYLPS